MVSYRLGDFRWLACAASRGIKIASGKSLVLPAPARLLPLLPTVNSLGNALFLPLPEGTPPGTAKGRGLSSPASGGRQYFALNQEPATQVL